MKPKRTDRLNSLLREVLSEVIRQEVKNPQVHPLSTVTSVEITYDLRHAKAYVSIIGTAEEKKRTLQALNQARKFIASVASKKVVMRYFPELFFKLDDSVEAQARIDELLG